jgi:cytochrome c peroxidase
MKNKHFYLFSVLLALLFGFAKLPESEPLPLAIPKHFPAPKYDFSKNPLTQEGVELGRRLFYDPILSRDSTVSCASCHLSFTAFTHVDHALSHGIKDRIGRRNSPALMNLAWSSHFMWDGGVNHLDFQALAPISDSTEMDSDIKKVVEKLDTTPRFAPLFRAAFGDENITGERVLKAISQFELTLVSAHSKYDRMKLGLDTFSVQEKNGYLLFQKNCARCHAEPLFTNGGFEKNGLPLDTILHDFGRMRITQLPADSLHFKVPTLRNIEFSYPYMHDGRFRKLRQVVDFYADNREIKPKIELSAHEKVDLTAFLLTLTDREFLFNPDFSFPKK